jgi:predicted  nucleic acid-binding Zn-ribbon protein
MRTECDGCGRFYTLTIIDADGVLIGDECPDCGYYTTRYVPGQRPEGV